MNDNGSEMKGTERVLKVLSLKGLKDVLSSQEKFSAWVENADPKDFRHFLSAVNNLLVRVGRTEHPDVFRGTKVIMNLAGERLSMSDGEEHDFIEYVPPAPEEIDELLDKTLSKVKILTAQNQLDAAAVFLFDAIALLQPFHDGNKRTARACFYALTHLSSPDSDFLTNLPQLIKDDLVGRVDEQSPRFASMWAELVNVYRMNVNEVIQSSFRQHWQLGGTTKVLDAREVDGNPLEWALTSHEIPDDSQTIESLAKAMETSTDDAGNLLFEVAGTVNMHSDLLDTQLAAFCVFLTRELNTEIVDGIGITGESDGIRTFDVIGFIREVLARIEEPGYVNVFADFISCARLIRSKAINKTLFSENPEE